MTAAWALTSINLALFVAFIGLALYRWYYLAIVFALMVNVVGTVYGIIFRQWYLVGINAAGALWVLWNWWKTRGHRKARRRPQKRRVDLARPMIAGAHAT